MAKDAVPESWKAGLVQADMGVAGWVEDLAKRIEHLASVSKAGGPRTGPDAAPYWLGGLFSPDAFVTASRQHVAGALSCSLDELGLSLVVGAEGETGPEGGWVGGRQNFARYFSIAASFGRCSHAPLWARTYHEAAACPGGLYLVDSSLFHGC